MNQSASSFLVRTACALALGLAVIAIPEIAVAQISVSITLAPPALPVYEQPVLAEEGGIWPPGFWDYDEGNFSGVPGPGCNRLQSACCGHPDIGGGAMEDMH